jgi:hypothetical protein
MTKKNYVVFIVFDDWNQSPHDVHYLGNIYTIYGRVDGRGLVFEV